MDHWMMRRTTSRGQRGSSRSCTASGPSSGASRDWNLLKRDFQGGLSCLCPDRLNQHLPRRVDRQRAPDRRPAQSAGVPSWPVGCVKGVKACTMKTTTSIHPSRCLQHPMDSVTSATPSSNNNPNRSKAAFRVSMVFVVAATLVFLGSFVLLDSDENTLRDFRLRLRNQHLERQLELVEQKGASSAAVLKCFFGSIGFGLGIIFIIIATGC